MKTISHLANNLNIGINHINALIEKEHIICDTSKPKKRVNEFQEEYIQQILIYEGKLDGFIFESKMNIPEEQEDFNEFKKRVYGKK